MCNYFGRHDVHGSKDEPIRGVVSTPWTPWAMPDLTKSWSTGQAVPELKDAHYILIHIRRISIDWRRVSPNWESFGESAAWTCKAKQTSLNALGPFLSDVQRVRGARQVNSGSLARVRMSWVSPKTFEKSKRAKNKHMQNPFSQS